MNNIDELQAVNALLSVVGAAPIPNLSTSLPDVETSQARLAEAAEAHARLGIDFHVGHVVGATEQQFAHLVHSALELVQQPITGICHL